MNTRRRQTPNTPRGQGARGSGLLDTRTCLVIACCGTAELPVRRTCCFSTLLKRAGRPIASPGCVSRQHPPAGSFPRRAAPGANGRLSATQNGLLSAKWQAVPPPKSRCRWLSGRNPQGAPHLLLCVYSLRCRTSELRPLGGRQGFPQGLQATCARNASEQPMHNDPGFKGEKRGSN